MSQSFRLWIAVGIGVVVLVGAIVAALVFVGVSQQRIGLAGVVLATATAPDAAPPTRAPRPKATATPPGGPKGKATAEKPTAAPSGGSEQSAARPVAATAAPTEAKPVVPTAASLTVAPTSPPALVEPQRPVAVEASGEAPASQDDRGVVTTFVAANATDGQLDTAWRVAGDGAGQWLRLTFAGPIAVSTIQLVPGYAKIDPRTGANRFAQNRRVVRARFDFSDGTSLEWRFEDRPQLQSMPVDGAVTIDVRITILETTAPGAQDGRDYTPLSEIVVIGAAR